MPALVANEAVEDREALEADPDWDRGPWMPEVLGRIDNLFTPVPLERVAHLRRGGRERYREGYLSSPEWQRTREAALLAAGHECKKCGARRSDAFGATLDVHHVTYERFGNELPTDLIVLCRPCHQEEHYEGAE